MTLGQYILFLGLLACERGGELALSARHARRLRARGAVELGRGHYPAMVAFHGAFLAACAAEALRFPAAPPPIALAALGGALLAQALRWWAVAVLGERWTTRILVLPGEPPVTGGPYRFARHPNYLAVALEVACVPLAFGSWRTALLFSGGNALLLAIRIRAEERALGDAWARAFHDRPRLLPIRVRAPLPSPTAASASVTGVGGFESTSGAPATKTESSRKGAKPPGAQTPGIARGAPID
jgi:methyltransferase